MAEANWLNCRVHDPLGEYNSSKKLIIYSNGKHGAPRASVVVLFDLADFKEEEKEQETEEEEEDEEEGVASRHRRHSDNKLGGGRASGTPTLQEKLACTLCCQPTCQAATAAAAPNVAFRRSRSKSSFSLVLPPLEAKKKGATT